MQFRGMTLRCYFTALFKNTRTLNFKSRLTFAFFAAVNHLSGPLRKQKFTSTGSKGAFHSTQVPVISVATSNGTDHFGLVRPEYSGSALKVVLFDRSGHFGRSDRNVPFHLTKLLPPVPLFCILLARTITKRAVAWVGSVQPEFTVPLGTWNFRNFKPNFC